MRSTADRSPVSEVAASLAAQRVGMVGLSPRLEKRITHILRTVGAFAKPLGDESSFQDWRDCDVLAYELALRNAELAARLPGLHIPVLVVGSWEDVLAGAAGAYNWAAGFLVGGWPDEQLLAALLGISMASARPRKLASRRSAPLALIADDDEDLTNLLEAVLGKLGLICRVARDGRAALALIRELQPEVVLLDVAMPVMTGFEVLAKVRQDPALENVAVALLTAYDDTSHVIEGSRLHADDYIVKPLDPGLLAGRVQRLLTLRRASDAGDPWAAGHRGVRA